MATDDPLIGLWAYFSIDVADSTRLKIASPHEWSNLIVQFLQMAPQLMASAWSDGRSRFRRRLAAAGSQFNLGRTAPQLERWKLLGDEVIFVQEFRQPNPVEFLYSVHTFINVLREVRKHLRNSNHQWPLELKGTIWLANEARNIKLRAALPEKEYLGPGIDVGFRIKPYALAKQIALSIEAAYLLALGLNVLGDETAVAFVNEDPNRPTITAPVIYVEGSVLAGVFEDPSLAYPQIRLRILPWTEASQEREHRRLVNKRGPITARELENTCLEWIQRQKTRLFLPFEAERPTGAVLKFRDGNVQNFNTPPYQPPAPPPA